MSGSAQFYAGNFAGTGKARVMFFPTIAAARAEPRLFELASAVEVSGQGVFFADPASAGVDDGTELTNYFKLTAVANGRFVRSVIYASDFSVDVSGGVATIGSSADVLNLEFNQPGSVLPVGSSGETVYFSRNTVAPFFKNGVPINAAVNAPRIVHEGIILEPGITNLIAAPANASLLAAAGWVDNAATASVGIADPDGGNYTKISQVAANGPQRRYYITGLGVGGAKSFSIRVSKTVAGAARYFVIADNGGPAHYAIFDVVTGIVTAVSGVGTKAYVADYGLEWGFALSSDAGLSAGLIAVGHSSNGTVISFAGDPNAGFYARMVQAELTPYPTTFVSGTRGAESCWVAMRKPLSSRFSIEVDYQTVYGSTNDRGATHEPILAVGAFGTSQSQELFLTSGTCEFQIYDGAAAEKHIVSGALSSASGGFYAGPRSILAASDGLARPALFVDGREQIGAPAGAGTAVFTGMTPTQGKLWIGCTSAGLAGGVIIRRIRVRSVSNVAPDVVMGSSYAHRRDRGYTPDQNVFAAIGDSITDAIQVDPSIPESWVSIAARAKGQTWLGHNYGVGSQGGEAIAVRWAKQLRPLVATGAYKTVVFEGGINTANNNQSAEEAWSIALAVLESILASGATKVICWSLMPGGDAVGSYRYIQKTGYNAYLAAWVAANASRGAVLYDAWASFGDFTTAPANPIIKLMWNQGGDGLHLNAAGNTKAGAEIAVLL